MRPSVSAFDAALRCYRLSTWARLLPDISNRRFKPHHYASRMVHSPDRSLPPVSPSVASGQPYRVGSAVHDAPFPFVVELRAGRRSASATSFFASSPCQLRRFVDEDSTLTISSLFGHEWHQRSTFPVTTSFSFIDTSNTFTAIPVHLCAPARRRFVLEFRSPLMLVVGGKMGDASRVPQQFSSQLIRLTRSSAGDAHRRRRRTGITSSRFCSSVSPIGAPGRVKPPDVAVPTPSSRSDIIDDQLSSTAVMYAASFRPAWARHRYDDIGYQPERPDSPLHQSRRRDRQPPLNTTAAKMA